MQNQEFFYLGAKNGGRHQHEVIGPGALGPGTESTPEGGAGSM